MAESQRYKVPQGFRVLLEALAREVLRAQPDDIYAFSALFFQVLQRHRSSTLIASSFSFDRRLILVDCYFR